MIVGPRRITQVNQVAIPVILLRQLGLERGDLVYFEVSGDSPTELRVLSARTVEARYESGRGSETRSSEGLGEKGMRQQPTGRRTTPATRAPGRRKGRADAD